jgi:hypothetical protein
VGIPEEPSRNAESANCEQFAPGRPLIWQLVAKITQFWLGKCD